MPGDLFPDGPIGHSESAFASLEETREAAEERQIRRALEVTGHEVGAAAKLLAISRTTLWEKMRRLQIKARDDD
jgi:two-component system response regulator HydG